MEEKFEYEEPEHDEDVKPDECFGCVERRFEGDHYHQYVNFFGETTSCWYIHGKVFRDPSEAILYLESASESTVQEAHDYIQGLPKKYN